MNPAAIRDQIDRILRSESFANKAQLRKLLEILSKNMDLANNLRPDQVIQELWPAETRTKRAADVATEMNRLRHALEAYYSVEGKTDPIVIVLPNRSVATRDGTQEKRWIVAEPRNGKEGRVAVEERAPAPPLAATQPRPQTNPRRGLRTGTVIVAICTTIGILGYVSLLMLSVHGQPASARLDGTVLRIMDAKGKELWSKNFPQGFGPYYYQKENGPSIWFEDLEGKGHINVLFTYAARASQQPPSSTLICYSDRGKEKWRWTPGRDLPELNGIPAIFLTAAVGVLKATPKRPPRIVVASMNPWWPSQIAILDLDGKTIAEYWHSGHLSNLMLSDLDGDGREEIIATGVANGYDHQATLVVLDPDRVFGASTEAQPEFQIHGMGIAQERLRLLFPRSDLNRAESFTYNYAIEPAAQGDMLRLTVMECPAPRGCPISYEFDTNFHLIAVYPGSDEFRSAHDRFYQNGKDAHTLGAAEKQAFLRVRCLVGCPSELVLLAQNYAPAVSFEKGWKAQSNPNDVWSYGYSAGFMRPITLYDATAQNGVNGPNAQYWLSSSAHVDVSPAAEYNHGPAFNDGNVDFLENEFLLVAGTGGQYSDLIFTAPLGGEYSLAGNFRGAQYGVGTAVAIEANGTIVFSSGVTSVGQIVPFRIPLTLQAGSKVVLSVGPGKGFQNTGVAVTITRPCASTDKPGLTPAGEITCWGSTVPKRSSLKTAKM